MSLPRAVETDSQRLFFALPLPDAAGTALQSACHQTALPPTARPSPPENYHLTLVFLGQVSPRQLPCIKRAAERIQAPAFQLQLDHLGHWPHPQVLWAAPSAPPAALERLVTDLQQQLAACGFAAEPRRYRPHVTLARRLRSLDSAPGLNNISWQAQQFHLYRSTPTTDGVRYQPIHSWPLQAD